jgi:glycosyltransferase involved in cell wall biosynthesis
VTVIIPVHNDVTHLKKCLTALAAQDYPPDRVSVVVVDNGSTEDLASALPAGDGRFSLVSEPQRGSYAARNTGVRNAIGDVLAFTDADCLPRTDWISRGTAALVALDGPDAVAGEVNLMFQYGSKPSTGPEFYEVIEGFNQRRFVDEWHFGATANLFVTVKVFERVGDFNNSLQSGGDLDWGGRLKAAGFRLDFAPDAIVDHPSRPSWSEHTSKSVRVAHGLADLTSHRSTRPTLKMIALDLRSSVSIWVTVWRMPYPCLVSDRVKYASSHSYAQLLRAGVRSLRLVQRYTSRMNRG